MQMRLGRAMLSWALLLLHGLLTKTTSTAMEHTNAQHHVPRTSLLPSCAKILEHIPEPQAAHLRDLIQLEGQGKRKQFYWSELRTRLISPPTDESEKIAFTTRHSLAEVEAFLSDSNKFAEIATVKVQEFLAKVKEVAPQLQQQQDGLIRACAMGHTNPHLYEYRPRVSLMLQNFKRPHIIQPYIARVQQCKELGQPVELLVNVDHPQDHEAWAWAAYNTSGLVVPVFSNNIHEIRAYNRLLHLSQGDIVVFLADDDLLPTSDRCGWIQELITLFDRWTNTGVVGKRGYQHCYSEATNTGPWFRDPVTDIKAHWVQRVDMSPMAFRKAALVHIGGMDETLSEPGMCGIISDWEVCHRMWTAGWEVMAAMPLALEHDGQEAGGTHKPATSYKCWGLQMGTAGQVMATHGHVQWETEMCETARRLNLERLELLDKSKCPYKAGCQL